MEPLRIAQFWGIVMCTYMCLLVGAHGSVLPSCGEGLVRHSISATRSRCCHRLPYNCPQDHVYTPCREEGGWDYCKRCEDGYIQLRVSNATHPTHCIKVENCPSEEHIPVGESRTCQCDWRKDHYFFFYGCETMPISLQCPEGDERGSQGQDLKEAMKQDRAHRTYLSCRPCAKGSYKNWTGIGACIPVTNCEQMGRSVLKKYSRSSDNVCGHLKTDLMPADTKLPATVVSGSKPTPPTGSSDDEDRPTSVSDKGEEGTPDWVIAVIVVLVVLVIVAGGVVWRCRNRVTQRFCRKPCPPNQDSVGVEMLSLRTVAPPGFDGRDEVTFRSRPLSTIPPRQGPLPPVPTSVPQAAGSVEVQTGGHQTDRSESPSYDVEGHGSEGHGHVYQVDGTHTDQGEGRTSLSDGDETTDSNLPAQGEGHQIEQIERPRPVQRVAPMGRRETEDERQSGNGETAPLMTDVDDSYSRINELGERPVADSLHLNNIPVAGGDAIGPQGEVPSLSNLPPMPIPDFIGDSSNRTADQ